MKKQPRQVTTRNKKVKLSHEEYVNEGKTTIKMKLNSFLSPSPLIENFLTTLWKI